MNIFVLDREQKAPDAPNRIVVVAETEQQARALAQEHADQFDEGIWCNQTTKCRVLGSTPEDEPAHIVCTGS